MNKLISYLDPFEVLFKDFMKTQQTFASFADKSLYSYPVDIIETATGIRIDIAAVGLQKEDIEIKIEDSNVLRVSYSKEDNSENKSCEETKDCYVHRGIARRSFNLGWKISRKYDLEKITAKMDKGLLSIEIPFAETLISKCIDIQ